MSKAIRNHCKPWTRADDVLLKTGRVDGSPTRVIALKLGRTHNAVRARERRLYLDGTWRAIEVKAS